LAQPKLGYFFKQIKRIQLLNLFEIYPSKRFFVAQTKTTAINDKKQRRYIVLSIVFDTKASLL